MYAPDFPAPSTVAVGFTVIYTDWQRPSNLATSYPAIVTQVFGDGAGGVNLKVLPPMSDIRDEGSVPHRSMSHGATRFWTWAGEDTTPLERETDAAGNVHVGPGSPGTMSDQN